MENIFHMKFQSSKAASFELENVDNRVLIVNLGLPLFQCFVYKASLVYSWEKHATLCH